MMIDNPLKWAYEALVNYAVYRVHGDAPGVPGTAPMPPDWNPEWTPLLSDLWEGAPEFSYEQKDYLMVRTCLAKHVQSYPQDRLLGELLTHTLYHKKPVGEFEIVLPFQHTKRKLAEIGPQAVRNACIGVAALLRAVAAEKRKQIDPGTEKVA